MNVSRVLHPWRLAAVVVVSLFLWGCGGGSSDSGGGDSTDDAAADTVDTAAVESSLKGVTSSPGVPAVPSPPGVPSPSQGTPAVKGKSASCPEDVKKKRGESFTCDVEISSGGETFKGTVEVTEKDDEGNKLDYKGKFSGGPIKSVSGTLNLQATVKTATPP